ncbi:MAG TPA: hypothetical protein V6C97_11555 [Oculatellaceae cyanobacterium]
MGGEILGWIFDVSGGCRKKVEPISVQLFKAELFERNFFKRPGRVEPTFPRRKNEKMAKWK